MLLLIVSEFTTKKKKEMKRKENRTKNQTQVKFSKIYRNKKKSFCNVHA